MDSKHIPDLILDWSRSFRCNEMTVDEIQDCFASLDVSASDVRDDVRKLIVESQLELDSIRYGMCTAGQRNEITRIFADIERLLARTSAK